MQVWNAKVPLPDDLSTAIGHIISRWAFIECWLQLITYTIAGVSTKQGRVAIREPRIFDHLAMIESLIELRDKAPPQCLHELKTTLPELENERNLLAHGIWVIEPARKILYVRSTKGSWQPDPRKPKVKRSVKPEALLRKKKDMRETIEKLDAAMKQVKALEKFVDSFSSPSQ